MIAASSTLGLNLGETMPVLWGKGACSSYNMIVVLNKDITEEKNKGWWHSNWLWQKCGQITDPKQTLHCNEVNMHVCRRGPAPAMWSILSLSPIIQKPFTYTITLSPFPAHVDFPLLVYRKNCQEPVDPWSWISVSFSINTCWNCIRCYDLFSDEINMLQAGKQRKSMGYTCIIYLLYMHFS